MNSLHEQDRNGDFCDIKIIKIAPLRRELFASYSKKYKVNVNGL